MHTPELDDYPDIMDYEARCENLESINTALLEALEACIPPLEVQCEEEEPPPFFHEPLKQARDAIKQAKGD